MANPPTGTGRIGDMTDLKPTLQALLQDSGYQTWLVAIDRYEVVAFEDDAAMGFACIFERGGALLKEWQALETKFLINFAPALKRAGEKTWNVYSVFLCSENAPEDDARAIRWIEENLERTRKITGIVPNGRSDLITALLPLLPIQYQPRLDSEDFDLTQRLRRRIASIAPAAEHAALDAGVTVTEVVRLLGAET
jgi:hypothetical protein